MAPERSIDRLLFPFQPFGVNLGLSRIQRLLAALGNPQENVQIVHVAGSNGKGSVCAYLASVLSTAGYRTGMYTSPHLVSWTERIQLGQGGDLHAIALTDLEAILQATIAAVDPNSPQPTLFEIITAAAWLHFAQQAVDIAIIEVGLGGRLDATNVCDRPLASVITSLGKEHWQVLGETLSKIATEKAGILKAKCPAVVGPLPEEARQVVAQRAQALNCAVTWVEPAQACAGGTAQAYGIAYALPLAGPIQLTNSAIALATLQTLRSQGWNISDESIAQGMATTRWPGRMEWRTWNGHPILTDGAHNPAAALALRDYVDTLESVRAGAPVTWVMGMLSTKEHEAVFRALLRGGDRLYTAPVPGHSSADPQALIEIAQQVIPALADAQATENLFDALALAVQPATKAQGFVGDPITSPAAIRAAVAQAEATQAEATSTLVCCGSLYLLGYFLERGQNIKKAGLPSF